MDRTCVDDARKIIVALDFPEAEAALRMASKLDPQLCRVKVGFELYVAAGPSVIEALRKQGFEIFLDLKFHDIPNTVASACRAAAALDVWMMNVHASGGPKMLQAAREAIDVFAKPPLLIAVTVLTSMDSTDLKSIGVIRDSDEQVLKLAELSRSCGLDGVVCSALEAKALRNSLGSGFLLVTPGIRQEDAITDDQKRVLTPAIALQEGASYLVMGRPITRATDPLAALQQIVESLT